MVMRGADGELRAFHNVCRHRGSTILEESCGKLVRIQCPYHAWTYDLDGRLQRAKHTDDLVDFEPAENGLVPVRCETLAGVRVPEPRPGGPAAPRHPRRPARPLRAVRLRLAPPRPADRLRGQRELEGDRRELLRVLPLPGHPPPAQPPDAVRHGPQLPDGRSVGGRLHGARRERGDDVDRRPQPRPAAAARHRRRRPPADLLLPRLAEPADEPPPRLPDDPPGLAGRAGPVDRPLRLVLPPGHDRGAGLRPRPTRSTSGT